MSSDSFLFHEYELDSILSGHQQKLRQHLENLREGGLKPETVDDLAAQLFEDFKVKPITIVEGAITVSVSETGIDVRHERDRHIIDRSRPFLIPGVAVDYFIPYSGDQSLFKCRPNTFNYNPPRAQITNSEIIISQSVSGTDASKTRGYFDNQLASLKQYLGWQSVQIDSFNNSLPALIKMQIDSRIARIQATQQSMAQIGFPVRKLVQDINPHPVPQRDDSGAKRTPKVKVESYDVSLSFAGEDRTYVERVAGLLKSRKVAVFYDRFEEAELWGKNLVDHLADIYRNRSRFVVMFISEHYVKKAWPKHERQHAQARALLAPDTYILPARFDDTPVPGMADTVSFIDLRTTKPDELVELILAKLGRVGPT